MDNSGGARESGSANIVADAELRKREEALREYYLAQEMIDRFDERSLKIKSWSVTTCGVALGFGVSENHPILFCIAAFGSLVFWYLESLWKTWQDIVIERSNEIEKLLASEHLDYNGPKMGATFTRSFRGGGYGKRLKATMMYPNVRVPHFFIFCTGVLLFIGSILNTKLQGIFGP